MRNEQKGRNFENDYAKILESQGYWVHIIERKKDGSQPFDIIACKDDVAIGIDCKTCVGKRFTLERIEDNQEYAFERFTERGNSFCYFVILSEELKTIFNIPAMKLIESKRKGVKSINLEKVVEDGYIS